MTLERATGIVLRTRPLTDTSLIVHWLTAESGRLAVVAKGARRPKSPFAGQIDLFYLADFTFVRSRRSELHTLREIKLINSHTALRENLSRLRQAAYCANLIEQNTEPEAPLPELFAMFAKMLDGIVHHPAMPQSVLAFEMKILAELGLSPNLSENQMSQGARQILSTFAKSDWETIFRLRLSDAQMTEIGQFLHTFLVYHLGRLPRNRAAAVGTN
jgi:DNA repair protein RecO (recombination protein O)